MNRTISGSSIGSLGSHADHTHRPCQLNILSWADRVRGTVTPGSSRPENPPPQAEDFVEESVGAGTVFMCANQLDRITAACPRLNLAVDVSAHTLLPPPPLFPFLIHLIAVPALLVHPPVAFATAAGGPLG